MMERKVHLVKNTHSQESDRISRKEVTIWIPVSDGVSTAGHYTDTTLGARNFIKEVKKINPGVYRAFVYQNILIGSEHKKKCPDHETEGITFIHNKIAGWKTICNHVIVNSFISELDAIKNIMSREELAVFWRKLAYIREMIENDSSMRIMRLYTDHLL